MLRSSILRGPGVVSFGGQVFYTAGNIKVEQKLKTFDIPVSTVGRADLRAEDVVTEITFVPAGQWKTAHLGVLLPAAYRNPVVGTSIYTSTDVPISILTVDGKEVPTYAAAAITKMPDVYLSAKKTTLGAMTIRVIAKDNTAWTDAAARYAIADAAFGDTSFAIADVPTLQYTAALAGASAPWDSFVSETGFTVSFALKTKPVMLDGVLVDEDMAGVDVSVKMTPVGVTLANVLTLMKLQGAGVRPGMSLAASAADMTIVAAGSGVPTVTINKVAPIASGQNYGLDDLRHGEMQFVNTRPGGTGAIFSVGVTA
jgi:hypothetical protein